jgi:hypothetical protein
LVVSLAGRHYTTTRPFLSLATGAGGAHERLKHCIDPAVKIFHGAIVSQDQIYVVCAIEPILDLPNSFLVRATLPKRQPCTYALGRCLYGADDAQGRHACGGAFRNRAKATALLFQPERAHGDDKLVRRKGIRHGVSHGGVRMCDGFFGQVPGGGSRSGTQFVCEGLGRKPDRSPSISHTKREG